MRPQDRALFNLLALCTGVVIVLWLTGCAACRYQVGNPTAVRCDLAQMD